VIKVDRQAA